MRIGSWNIRIQRSGNLLSKFDAIEHLISKFELDLVALLESDYPNNRPLPTLEGFESYSSSESPSRLVVYAKDGLVLKAKSYPGDLTAVVNETNQSTFGFLHSEFTTNAYSKDSATLSNKQRRLKIIDFLDWTNELP